MPVARHLLDLISGLLALLALLAGIQLAWQYWGSGLDVDTVSQRLESSVSVPFDRVEPARVIRDWHERQEPPAGRAPASGEIIGYLDIPRLGADWEKPIQEGVQQVVLDNMGVGHYPDTTLPGGRGNTSYAGHRAPADLGYLDRLEEGDVIYIRTADVWYRYETTGRPFTVPMSRVDVVAPTAVGVERGLTLTTCDPMFSVRPAVDRLIVHATLTGWARVSDGMPAEYAHDSHDTGVTVRRVVRDTARAMRMPVTGLLAACTAVAWLVVDLTLWILCHRRMRDAWRDVTFSPLALLWRLQAGPYGWGPGGVPATLIRLVPATLLLMAVTFACWRWACPWIADTIPLFASPHPAVG